MPFKDFVFSGSGARYPIYIGAWRATEKFLAKRLTRPRKLGACSGGAIVAAGIASGKTSTELEKMALATLPGPLLDRRWIPEWASPQGAYHGFWKGDGILKALRAHLPEKWIDYELDLHIVTFNVSRGEYKVWSRKDAAECNDVPRLVRASMSLPCFDSVLINGEWHEDGGFGANFPLDMFGNGKDVIGFRFKGHDARQGVRRFQNKMHRMLAMIDDFIEATSREHMDDATFARTCFLETQAGSMNLWMGVDDVKRMIAEGEAQAGKWLASLG